MRTRTIGFFFCRKRIHSLCPGLTEIARRNAKSYRTILSFPMNFTACTMRPLLTTSRDCASRSVTLVVVVGTSASEYINLNGLKTRCWLTGDEECLCRYTAGFTSEHDQRMRKRDETEHMVCLYTVWHSPKRRIDPTWTYWMQIPFEVPTVDR